MKIMKGTNKYQAGFSILEVAFVIVIIAIIAGVTWFAYEHNKPWASSAAPSANQPANHPDPGQPGPTVGYLYVKEWGVKVPLSEAIKDAYYVIGGYSDSPDGLPGGVLLGLRSKKSAACNPENNNQGKTGAIGAMLRFQPTETDAVTGKPLVDKYPGGTTIDDYYYTYQSGKKNNACGSESTLKEVDTAFDAASQIIVPVQTNDQN